MTQIQSGEFQWNAGGWFGGQIGASCWMLVAATLSFSRDRSASGVVFVLFTIANLVGLRLWRTRDRLSVYTALQILLVAAGSCSLAAVYILDRAGIWLTIQTGGAVSAVATYFLIVAGVIALLTMFHFRRRRSAQNN